MVPHGGPGALAALEGSGLAAAMRNDLWLYSIVVILVGAVVMFDLRVLGLSRGMSTRALARHLLPWSAGALLVIVPTGLMMFSAHATDFIGNPAFVTKITLILVAFANAVAFHVGVFRGAPAWDTHRAAPAMARLHALVSLALWFSVITCGRLIAYV
jgi:hypothetical protein